MKQSEIAELKEARRRALGAEIFVSDESSRPTSKSSKGRWVGERELHTRRQCCGLDPTLKPSVCPISKPSLNCV